LLIAVALVPVYWLASNDLDAPEPPALVAVHNNQNDGSVWEVQKWLIGHALFPESIRYMKWYPVHKLGDNYAVQVKYNAMNESGGRTTTTILFQINETGEIYSHTVISGTQWLR